jgi:hypothetical protein
MKAMSRGPKTDWDVSSTLYDFDAPNRLGVIIIVDEEHSIRSGQVATMRGRRKRW